MKSFRETFEAGFRKQFLATLEKDIGLKPEDYLPLLQGQVSVAVLKGTRVPADETSEPTFQLVIDARSKSEELKARLAEVRAKLTAAKYSLRVEKVRGVEFFTLTVERPASEASDSPSGDDPADKEDADVGDAESARPAPVEITFGQVDSALVIATATAGLDRLVARLTGGVMPTLSESPDFQVAEAACGFRESVAYGYVQAASLIDTLQSGDDSTESGEGGFGVPSQQILSAAGLDGLRSISASARQSESGLLVRFFAAVPESRRNGLFKLLRPEVKDASPPPFVPTDAAEFQRIRLNGQQLWTGVEALLQQVSPQLSTFLLMSVNALGKDRDPSFDFRKMFFGNLGDDLVTYGKPARGKTLAELQRPPSITLVGAVNANEMMAAIRSLASLLPGGPGDLTEREVNGKKILTVKLPGGADQPERSIEVASSGGYVAFATDAVILEQFLRSAEGTGRSLKDLPGLADAAQQVGGMGTGVFGFQNQRESAAGLWEALRTGGGLDKLIPSVGSKQVEDASSWLNFNVLPPFDQISKYLGINVSSGSWETQGFLIRSFTPVPK